MYDTFGKKNVNAHDVILFLDRDRTVGTRRPVVVTFKVSFFLASFFFWPTGGEPVRPSGPAYRRKQRGGGGGLDGRRPCGTLNKNSAASWTTNISVTPISRACGKVSFRSFF